MRTRRQFMGQACGSLAGSLLLGNASTASGARVGPDALIERKIPSSGEIIPVIGMGTSGSFQISPRGPDYQALKEVLKRFFDAGATVIDTAPTYGNAEDVLGALLEELKLRKRAFLATKLSRVSGRSEGLKQFRETLTRLQTDTVELLQVHNLGDWKTQLALARELKEQGKVKYVGLTHYVESAQEQLADIVQQTRPDFIQINYSVTQRGAEKRLFPMARELGVAVLANRNFDDGDLLARLRGRPLPGWAAEAGARSWAQMLLKFALSNEAVTAVIPATGNPEHQSDNLRAGIGPLLSSKQKQQLIQLVA